MLINPHSLPILSKVKISEIRIPNECTLWNKPIFKANYTLYVLFPDLFHI